APSALTATTTTATTRPAGPITATALAALARRLLRCLALFGRALGGIRLGATLTTGRGNRLARRAVATITTITAIATRLGAVAGIAGITFRLRLQRLHRETQTATLVAVDQLHLHPIALLDDVFGLFRATVTHLRDVQERFGSRQDLDEGAERRRALDEALVRIADDRLLRDRLHHLARTLHRLAADRRDGDRARIVDADLGARLVLNAADRLALGPDEIADLLGVDLDGHDARGVRREIRLGRRKRLVHLGEDVQPTLARLVERLTHNAEVEALDLDVHLDGRDAVRRSGDLEIHVAEVILGAENVGEDRVPRPFLDQAHRHTGDGRARRHAGIEQRQRAAADGCHRRRPVRL